MGARITARSEIAYRPMNVLCIGLASFFAMPSAGIVKNYQSDQPSGSP